MGIRSGREGGGRGEGGHWQIIGSSGLLIFFSNNGKKLKKDRSQVYIILIIKVLYFYIFIFCNIKYSPFLALENLLTFYVY